MAEESIQSEPAAAEPRGEVVDPETSVVEPETPVVDPETPVVEPETQVVEAQRQAVEAQGDVVGPEETVEGLPVLADVRPIEPAGLQALPAVQAAAAAATGFVAGAATVALVRRHTARRLARMHGLDLRRPGTSLPAAGAGRTFLVHVRVLGRPEA